TGGAGAGAGAGAGLGERLARLNLEGDRSGKERTTAGGGGGGGDDSDNGEMAVGSDVGTPARTGTDNEHSEVEGGSKHRGKGKKSEMPIWTGVVTTKSAKSQALEAMKALIAWQPIPVMRARMRLRVSCPLAMAKQAAKSKAVNNTNTNSASGDNPTTEEQQRTGPGTGTIKDQILAYIEQVESQDVLGDEWEVVGFVEPGAFKGLGEFVGGETRGRGRVEVLDMAVTHED
ncbi:hypothetical protein HC762_01925, partial [bacterium]|nr:hypothetical protein [bacterium]